MRTWGIANRGDPKKIPDYIKVKGMDHMVSHLHMPNRGNMYIEKG